MISEVKLKKLLFSMHDSAKKVKNEAIDKITGDVVFGAIVISIEEILTAIDSGRLNEDEKTDL